MTVPVPPQLEGLAETRLRPGLLLRVAAVVGFLALLNGVAVPLVFWVEQPHRVVVHVERCHKPYKAPRQCDVTVTGYGHPFHTTIESEFLGPGATVPGWSTWVPTGVTTSRWVAYADPVLTLLFLNILALVGLALLRMATSTMVASAAWHRLFHRRRVPGRA